MPSKRTDPLERVRRICMALPEVTERLSHGEPTWFVRGKKVFVSLSPHGHHQNDFPHLTCAAPPGVQQELVHAIAPVVRVDHRPVGDGKVGPLSDAIQKLYFDVVRGHRREYREQWCTAVYAKVPQAQTNVGA